jgi:hypothetical protein
MENISAGTRATDPELDEALARAIRHLIAEAIEAGTAEAPSASQRGQPTSTPASRPGQRWRAGHRPRQDQPHG